MCAIGLDNRFSRFVCYVCWCAQLDWTTDSWDSCAMSVGVRNWTGQQILEIRVLCLLVCAAAQCIAAVFWSLSAAVWCGGFSSVEKCFLVEIDSILSSLYAGWGKPIKMSFFKYLLALDSSFCSDCCIVSVTIGFLLSDLEYWSIHVSSMIYHCESPHLYMCIVSCGWNEFVRCYDDETRDKVGWCWCLNVFLLLLPVTLLG